VAILAIDEPSFQQLGQGWPFPRSLHARLIDRLREDGARAIGFDVVFADPAADPAQDAALAQAVGRAVAAGMPVVLASSREKVDSASATPRPRCCPCRPCAMPEPSMATPVWSRTTTSWCAACPQRGPLCGHSRSTWASAQRPRPPQTPTAWWPTGARAAASTRSYYQALEPGLLPAGYFRGKVVLVGRSALTASELQHSQADLFNAPFAALGGERLFPGVELQATLLDNHVTGAALRPVPEGWSLTLVLLALAVLVPASVRWHPGTVAGVAAGLSGAVLLLSWWLFAQARLWLPPLLPLAAVVAIYGATALVAYATARLRRAPGARHVCTVCAPEVSSA
jgi:adenylate cyclase